MNIDLIIFFNVSKHVNNIPILLELYKPYFKNIYFYASTPVVECNHEVHFINDISCQGFFGYSCIQHFLSSKKNNDTDGFVYLHDDVLLNIKYLQNLDLTNLIYFSEIARFSGNHKSYKSLDHWDKEWWGKWNLPSGKSACKNLLNDINNQLFCDNDFIANMADFFYLPYKLVNQNFVSSIDLFAKNQVHLEIALPTIFRKFFINLPIQNYHSVPNGRQSDNKIDNIDYEVFKRDFFAKNLYYHPVKLSNPIIKEYAKKLLSQ